MHLYKYIKENQTKTKQNKLPFLNPNLTSSISLTFDSRQSLF